MFLVQHLSLLKTKSELKVEWIFNLQAETWNHMNSYFERWNEFKPKYLFSNTAVSGGYICPLIYNNVNHYC